MVISFLPSMFLTFVFILLAMAFFTLLERKVLGYIQLRKGPNKVGLVGLPQPFADALKLLVKEQAHPLSTNIIPFYLAPALSLVIGLLLWTLYPSSSPAVMFEYSVIVFLAVSSMNVYTTFIAGWSSNSKYALLGALRGVAQTISYEVSMGLILLSSLFILKSLSLNSGVFDSVSWVFFMFFPIFVMWFITLLAETNRTPFDMAEGESELVSGFNIEYSAGPFALIFMAEYTSIIAMSMITVFLFIPSTYLVFGDFFNGVEIIFLSYVFIWLRGTLPRMRYDRLMSLTWKSFLPLILSFLIVEVVMVVLF